MAGTGDQDDEGFPSELSRELSDDVLARFVRYARIDTQARPGTDEVPSSEKQLDLSRLLVEELKGMGAADVTIDDHGIVFATVPPTVEGDVPVVGFVAHVDTSPDASGTGVDPQVVTYEGGRLPLPKNPDVALDPADSPQLEDHIGHRLITTDGTTLLGADDKAGVAAIMTAASYLLSHPEVRHGPVRIAFTTDEEVGHGTRFFDIERFGARCAYTVDGSIAGEIEDESFSAMRSRVTFHGFSWHPGYAKGRLVNSIKLAQKFLARLPQEDSPEETEGRQGYLHPVGIQGIAEKTTIEIIIRDFEMDKAQERADLIESLAEEVAAEDPRARAEVESFVEYRNMRDVLAETPDVLEKAVEAVRRTGLEPKRSFIRGGTDGSMLTLAGLPTPNLFAGSQDFHSVKEWACLADIAAAAETVVRLAEVWAE